MLGGRRAQNRNSGPAPAGDPPLFQRRIHRSEIGVEGGADAVDGGNDHDADANRDQTIFNGGWRGLIVNESSAMHPLLKLHSPPLKFTADPPRPDTISRHTI